MDNKYYEKLEECRKDTENGAKVLIERSVYDSETGKIDMLYSLVKKNDEYVRFKYFKYDGWKRKEDYKKWCGNYYDINVGKYQDAETLIIELCKDDFRDECRRVASINAKDLR